MSEDAVREEIRRAADEYAMAAAAFNDMLNGDKAITRLNVSYAIRNAYGCESEAQRAGSRAMLHLVGRTK